MNIRALRLSLLRTAYHRDPLLASIGEVEESDNLPPDPGVLAQEIVVDLESAFEQFRERSHWTSCVNIGSRRSLSLQIPLPAKTAVNRRDTGIRFL